MGFFDKLLGKKSNKCAFCKEEFDSLDFKKKFDEGVFYFCSKQCSQKFRKLRKKRAKNPPNMGSGLPW